MLIFGLKKIAKTLDVLEPYDYVKWQYELAALKSSNEMKKYTSFFGNFKIWIYIKVFLPMTGKI